MCLSKRIHRKNLQRFWIHLYIINTILGHKTPLLRIHTPRHADIHAHTYTNIQTYTDIHTSIHIHRHNTRTHTHTHTRAHAHAHTLNNAQVSYWLIVWRMNVLHVNHGTPDQTNNHVFLLLDIELCKPNPCEHGGNCIKTTDDTFNCSCIGMWHGNLCESEGNLLKLLCYVIQCNC